MQIQIKVSTEILRKQSEEIRCSLQEIKQDSDEIRTIVTGSKNYWEGESSEEHQRRLRAFADDADTTVARLLEHPDDLLKMAGIYESTENSILNINNRLPADVIV